MLMPTTPPRNKHFMLPSRLPDTALSLVVTLPYTAKPHPVGTMTSTLRCLSAMVTPQPYFSIPHCNHSHFRDTYN